LLDEQERLLWARLSVFAGGFEEDAVTGVCSDPRLPAGRIAGMLGALVEKSILKRQLRGNNPPRYWLLETLRQYGRQRLRELDEEMVAQKRHLEWIRTLGKMVGAWDSRQAEMFTGCIWSETTSGRRLTSACGSPVRWPPELSLRRTCLRTGRPADPSATCGESLLPWPRHLRLCRTRRPSSPGPLWRSLP
jgi:hypothetical protein